MTDLISFLQQLRRPRFLIRTARIGVEEYRRNPHLKRLLGYDSLPATSLALKRLITMEEELDSQRRNDDSNYPVVRHIEVLVAMMGEARLLQATAQSTAPTLQLVSQM
ncbi:DUF6477 family protein [Puniceibacterium sp. IMCC21224]|uniref:DUF6477 family protein n=1 Tax=Puniceibacterium sp. IMCC21224 TaxID=1618204 RepID=UPI00064DFAA5|nr:DUF6477 family protein [Puniceibacterium sp. IMCC21224]KMK66891.1 hypothetical protein IMCC21224_111750 [Puniceibacterium sp. IMCC21224]